MPKKKTFLDKICLKTSSLQIIQVYAKYQVAITVIVILEILFADLMRGSLEMQEHGLSKYCNSWFRKKTCMLFEQ